MARVYITTNDPVAYYLYDEQECNDMFGDEHIREYGTVIPDELLKRYKESYVAFWKVQKEIELLIKLSP